MNWNMPKISPEEIAFDIDGVLADTIGAFIQEANNKYGIKIRYEDIREYDLKKAIGMNEDILLDLATKILYYPLEIGIKPIDGAVDVLKKISKKSRLLFVTARPYKEGIQKWVLSYLKDIDKSLIHIIATGTHEEKVPLLKSYGIRYFVEDRLETCFLLKDASITPIVFEQPWNKKPHPFIRVRSWKELEKIIDLS